MKQTLFLYFKSRREKNIFLREPEPKISVIFLSIILLCVRASKTQPLEASFRMRHQLAFDVGN